ncbi:MAG: ABC transporter substrate-binding protein [Bacteroidales bacterium]|nr:ABC transporter substrate-binding protein [Bacteroidales bacterium]
MRKDFLVNCCFFPTILIFLLVFLSCQLRNTDQKEARYGLSAYSPQTATGFRIYEAEGFRVMDITSADVVLEKFILVDRNEPLTHDFPEDGLVISIPVESMVCLSATHIAYADALGLMDKISGVASADYVVSAKFNELLKEGKIREIGIADHFKVEQLIQLSPEIILATAQQGQGYENLKNAGLTMVPLAEHLENHPLGRAEWIKCLGVLFGKEKEAMLIFDSISREYNRLKMLTLDVVNRPVVLSGKQYGGFWNLPGGKSYFAQMIDDAGATYIWADNNDSGSLMLDFEVVYDRGMDADFWRFLVWSRDGFSIERLIDEDARYAGLKAFKEKKILTCNTFEKPYFQRGLLEPHVILADYISIFHPELLPDHQPVYYELLK